MIIGHKIKNIRELKNLTQEYMAERLDISQSAYSKLEKESSIADDKLDQIAEILEVKPEDIRAFDSQKYFNSVVCCGSLSTNTTLYPLRCNPNATFPLRVVLPTPPF